ncbi:synaptopodin-2-like [Sinocyclocheilus anshuiensis]|uniref:synaptopodin-2-like n=1 Tax=Sinocyclocheilus anshuiensis TaxID=1608454 RepID=UPI0007B85303|nr:PREDICTED: synaptopodin-2-like [Sinocyclocheilus anshuiensis]
MEHLPQTKGKGVLMFAKRRQRMDELSEEQEGMRLKGSPVHAPVKPPLQEQSTQAPQDIYVRQQQPFQQQMLPQSANGMNGHQGSGVPRSLISNRTAKPFTGGHNQGQKSFSPVKGVSSPTPKKPENIFKVPVPVNTTPQVWSPTSDIIASRDERITIPAIKTGILPETKRRGANKTDSKEMPPLQKKGKQKSLTESVAEDDFLSLGAEACNFMQAPRIKQKNPPPVLPKPVINPARPPWSAERFQSPLAPSSSVPAMGHTQVHAVPQQSPSNLYQSAWTPEPSHAQHTPASLRAGQSKTSRISSQNDGNSVASCPPQHLNTYVQASKSFPKGYSSDAGASEGLNLKGKGAELFARRQSRMDKFVVDDETVRASKARSSSPTLSMPSTWKHPSNVRARPPVSYNPILSPFYPLAVVKQPPPATSAKMKPKANKEKTNPPPKHLNVLDVMKHQPYQLNSSLFTYNSIIESKQTSAQTPASFQPQSLACEPSAALSRSLNSSQSVKQNLVSVPYPYVPQSASNEATITPQQSHDKQLTMRDSYRNKGLSNACMPSASSEVNVCVGSSLPVNNEYASRCAIPVAPRPKFSAKKTNTGGKQWKPVIFQR